jgi:beta-glucanase (GH16 family)
MKTLILLCLLLTVTGSEYFGENPTAKEMPLKKSTESIAKVPPAAVDKTKEEDGWNLVWNDEFHSETSLIKWNPQNWPSEKNGEWQYYLPENIDVRDDLLVISSRKEPYKGRSYTSGAVTTENKFEFTYGKIEIRAKLPKGKGIFPAFWLVNSDEDWLPEIDIMENIGQNPKDLYFVVHWKDENGKQRRDYSQLTSETDFSEGFHVYGLIWEPGKIVWTVDGKPVFKTEKYSPDTPLYLYLNTAVGGNWPGPPDPQGDYPKELLIDYVRVYQQGGKVQ